MNRIYVWLLMKLIGKRSVAANLTHTGTLSPSGAGAVFQNCVAIDMRNRAFNP